MLLRLQKNHHTAFTLIEIMVVVAIIGLLVAVLLPTFGTVRERARVAQTSSQFQALDTGIALFRSEQALGQVLPPSATDNPDDRQLIANPRRKQGGQFSSPDPIRVAGAHLLFHALVGADGLGPPGFKDFGSDGTRDGRWWNDTHDDDGGAYELSENDGSELRTRYGSPGYVDDKMRESAKSFFELDEKGVIQNLDELPTDAGIGERTFTDAWGTPILYYRASRASKRIVADVSQSGAGRTGIYWQEDNGLITGSGSPSPYPAPGLDFGPGKEDGRYHGLYHDQNTVPPVTGNQTQIIKDILENEEYDDSFVRFILDESVRVRPTPVNPDSYLLISAGPDARYGTDDDVTNWTRKVD